MIIITAHLRTVSASNPNPPSPGDLDISGDGERTAEDRCLLLAPVTAGCKSGKSKDEIEEVSDRQSSEHLEISEYADGDARLRKEKAVWMSDHAGLLASSPAALRSTGATDTSQLIDVSTAASRGSDFRSSDISNEKRRLGSS